MLGMLRLAMRNHVLICVKAWEGSMEETGGGRAIRNQA